MRELFVTFLASPTRESYIAVRSALISSAHYEPYSNELKRVSELLDAGDFEQAQDQLAEAMPNLLLSPSAHLMLSYIARKLQDEKTASVEGAIAARCCEGILATGDGTRESPYLVARTSDEYDVLHYLNKELAGQALIHDADRFLDCVSCDDGSELWFDITEAYSNLNEGLKAPTLH